MLSKDEKRFIRYWEEQRIGGKASYFLLYSLIGTFIMSLFVLVVFLLLLQYWFSYTLLAAVTGSSFIICSIMAALAWSQNEKKFKRLIKREIERSV
ncbi:MAG: hypothetical protein H7Y31_12935 [Chitinophagaceae bacterium]|nr:hypothetical protein [Chitinophagaceae bacterium]